MIYFTTEFRVRYAETDQMGVAHHSNYLIWFELARVRLMESLDLSYREIEKDGYLMPVIDAQLKYLKPARFDDILKIKALIESKVKAKITYNYEIININNEIICTGSTIHGFINNNNKAVKPPRKFLIKINSFF